MEIGFPAERMHFFQVSIKLAQPFPAPELRTRILRKRGFFSIFPGILGVRWGQNILFFWGLPCLLPKKKERKDRVILRRWRQKSPKMQHTWHCTLQMLGPVDCLCFRVCRVSGVFWPMPIFRTSHTTLPVNINGRSPCFLPTLFAFLKAKKTTSFGHFKEK